MRGKRIRKAHRKVTPLKEVGARLLKDGWCIDLPDWRHIGNYHLHIKGRKWEELQALRDCVNELDEEDTK